MKEFEFTASTVGITRDTADYVPSSEDLLRELCGDDSEDAIVPVDESPPFEVDEPAQAEPAVVEVVAVADVSISDELVSLTDEYLEQHRGHYFIWDIETVPDETRFPEPVMEEKPRQEVDLAELQKKKADDISAVLKSGVLVEDQLAELLELENGAKKPRSGVTGDIMKAIKELQGEYNDWLKFATDPWKNRIVAMSWSFVGEDKIHTITASNRFEEMCLLSAFWALHDTGTRVGFNTAGFDDPTVIARSMILQVENGRPMDTGRYSKASVDMMLKLFGGVHNAIDCKSLAHMLGIQPPAGDLCGADVFGLVQSGDWARLKQYSASDVFVEKELFLRMRRYLQV